MADVIRTFARFFSLKHTQILFLFSSDRKKPSQLQGTSAQRRLDEDDIDIGELE